MPKLVSFAVHCVTDPDQLAKLTIHSNKTIPSNKSHMTKAIQKINGFFQPVNTHLQNACTNLKTASVHAIL